MIHPVGKTYPVRDLQRNYRGMIDDLKKRHDAAILIRNSVPEAVLLDIQTYNALLEESYPVDYAYTEKLVRQAQASVVKGKAKKLTSWDALDG